MESKAANGRIGKVYDLKGKEFSEVLANSIKYRKAVKKHGMIILKWRDLSAEELKEFASKFGDELVKTSKNNIYGNFDPKTPHIFRVGNVLADGSIKKGSKMEQAIWHQDLNNAPHHMAHTLSFLQSKIRPKSGGGTQFIDLVTGWKNYKKNLSSELIN